MTRHFLIADRDPHIREFCRRLLLAKGHEADVAATGLECLNLLREKSPAVLVLDPHLLWGDGAGVLDILSSEQPVRNPIVLLTTDSEVGPMVSADFSTKPFAASFDRPRNLCELRAFVQSIDAAAELAESQLEESELPRTGTWR